MASFVRLQLKLSIHIENKNYFSATTEREVNGEDWRNVYNDVANLISFECVQITARKFEK